MTLIPEEWEGRTIRMQEVVDILVTSILKRMADDKPYGVALVSEGVMEHMSHQDLRELDYVERVESTYAGLGVEDADALARGAWRAYLDEWPRQTRWFPETPRVLDALRGRYRLGVITNYMDGPTCQLVFDKLGYRETFDALVVSAELGYRKPSRVIFERALRETGSSPENCVMVGDLYEADIVGANNMGMKSVLVDVYESQQRHYGEATAAIQSIGELPAALDKIDAF